MNGTTGYGNAVGRGLCAVLAILLLGGCSHTGPEPSSADGTDPARSSTPASSAAASTAEPVPATLEQELLKRRGLAFDRSDYKKFVGGEGILDIHSEFDLNVDHSYSDTIDEIVVSGGKVYFANCHTAFADGRNIREVGALPESGAVQYWHYTYDGEMGSMYFAGGAGYKVSCAPLSASPLDPAQDPLFEKQEKNKKYINLLFIVLAAVVVFVSIIVLISNQVKCQDKLEEKKRLEAEAAAISERVGEKQNRLDRRLYNTTARLSHILR